MLKIQDFAILCKCSTQTLRYYDRIDLLKPYHIDRMTGYRYYKEAQANTFFRIKELQAVGWTIKEIKATMDQDDEDLIRIMEEKIKWQSDRLNRSIELFHTYRERKMKREEEIKKYSLKFRLQITQQDHFVSMNNQKEQVTLFFKNDPRQMVELLTTMQKTILIGLEDFSDFKEPYWDCSKVYTNWKDASELAELLPCVEINENQTCLHLFHVSSAISIKDIAEALSLIERKGVKGNQLFNVSLSEEGSNSYGMIYSV